MSQFELFEIDNPCIGVCQTGKKGYCKGCLRSRQERQWWYQFDDDQKHRILTLIAKRQKKLARLRLAHITDHPDPVTASSTPDLFDDIEFDILN